jgi:hypothetical protein
MKQATGTYLNVYDEYFTTSEEKQVYVDVLISFVESMSDDIDQETITKIGNIVEETIAEMRSVLKRYLNPKILENIPIIHVELQENMEDLLAKALADYSDYLSTIYMKVRIK